jgi:hypothetical protein
MRSPGRLAAIALLIAPSLFAQSLFFGDPVPQTHTRYGTTGALPRLVSNGQEVFLFWATETKLRVTLLVDGQKRAGRPVLSGNIVDFDAVWTGSYFLVAAVEQDAQGARHIRGRVVSASGEVISAPFTIVENGDTPSLTTDGARVLLTYNTQQEHASTLLRLDGTPATGAHIELLSAPAALDAALATGGPGFVSIAAHAQSVTVTTFLSSGDIDDAAELSSPAGPSRRVAAGSNGHDVLLVWTNGSAMMDWATVRANGDVSGRSSLLGTNGATDVAVAWNGTRWVISFIASGKLQTRLFDGTTSAEAHAPVKALDTSPVSLVSLNGRTTAAWRGTGSGQPVLLRDIAGAGNGNEGAFSAAEQTLHTTASAHDAALLVWSELRDGKRTLHAGIRTSDGNWRENRIGTVEEAVAAASDGTNFLVVRKSENGWSAVNINDSAEILASTPVIRTFTPTGITWDGSSWVVIGTSGGSKVYVARVMPWGVVSTPALIEQVPTTQSVENPRIAAGGGGFLAIWQDSHFTMCFPVCDPYESSLRGTRLTASLERVDPMSLEIAPDEALSPDLYWDGTRFQLFWLDNGAVETRSLRPDAAGSGTTRIAGAQVDTGKMRATLTLFGTAITSDDGEVLLIRNDELIVRYAIGIPNSADALVNVGQDVAYVQAQRRDPMPYHGASHIFVQSGGLLPRDTMPLAPRIVRASMTENGRQMIVEWTPPLDEIRGYRLEYRVDDGTWNEFDAWFPATATWVSIEPWLDGVQYQFRIRAISDSGVSEYSTPATVRALGRRRSMR